MRNALAELRKSGGRAVLNALQQKETAHAAGLLKEHIQRGRSSEPKA
ncbi:MAG: hypothetical protein IJW17_04695 [Lentisphaeria bacterium]|nr:hypothetical protein [Lentisphaeria bacterium]